MTKNIIFTVLITLFTYSNAFAGFSYSNYDSGTSAIASVEIQGKGIYNLVVSVQFAFKPYDKREYTSDAYEELIKRLKIEWRSSSLDKILESNKYKVTDLKKLKSSLDNEIKNLIKTTKIKYGVKQNTEVVYSITGLYLIQTKDK